MGKRSIERVLADQTSRLMSLPGVVGTALGRCDGEPCIKVLASRITPELVEALPSAIEGYRVEVQETGEIRALDGST